MYSLVCGIIRTVYRMGRRASPAQTCFSTGARTHATTQALREVRGLAKLEGKHVIRYHSAWMEYATSEFFRLSVFLVFGLCPRRFSPPTLKRKETATDYKVRWPLWVPGIHTLEPCRSPSLQIRVRGATPQALGNPDSIGHDCARSGRCVWAVSYTHLTLPTIA